MAGAGSKNGTPDRRPLDGGDGDGTDVGERGARFTQEVHPLAVRPGPRIRDTVVRLLGFVVRDASAGPRGGRPSRRIPDYRPERGQR